MENHHDNISEHNSKYWASGMGSSVFDQEQEESKHNADAAH